MVKRITESYQVDDSVEIKLDDGIWWPGQVFRHASPGVWVRVSGNRLWFVTNTRNIRPARESLDGQAEAGD